MAEFILKHKNRDALFLLPLVLLDLLKTFDYHFWLLTSGKGFPTSPDGIWYINYANGLLENFSIGLQLNDILYFSYNVSLAAMLAVFHSTVPIVLLQGLVASLSIILVYKIARMVFNRMTAVLAGLFYYSNWEITLLSTYVLTDTFFNALLLLCMYLLLKTRATNDRRWYYAFLTTLAYLAFFRPTGLVVLAMVILYLLLQIDRGSMADFLVKHRLLLFGTAVSCVIIVGVLYSQDVFVPFAQSLQDNAKMVLYNVYAKGWIYDKSTVLDHVFKPDYSIDIYNSLVLSFLVNNWEHVAILYERRMLAFLGGWVLAIDFRNLAGVLFFAWKIIPTALFAFGTYAALKNGLFRKASILWLITGGVFLFCVLLFVDAFYRYRLPAIPYIAIIAAYGADRVIQTLLLWRKKGLEMLGYGKQNSDCRSGV